MTREPRRSNLSAFAAALGRKGGPASAASLTPEERSAWRTVSGKLPVGAVSGATAAAGTGAGMASASKGNSRLTCFFPFNTC